MKTLVTGANGFIGTAVARKLLAVGKEVKALVRTDSDCRNLQDLPVELVYGDLTDKDSLANALKGCETLYHVGGFYRLWCRDSSLFYKINVEGTRNIMLAALAAGVARIVYTSSIATLGTATQHSIANEETPVNRQLKKGHYKQSKYLAEQEVLKLIQERSLPVVIVNPTAPIGPGDIKPTPTGRVIRDAARGRIPAFVDTDLNIVHVNDVAQGHLQAFEHGRIGERYILGGENMSLRQILEVVADATQRPPPKVRLSPNLVLPLAYLAQAWAHFTRGAEPMLTVDGVRLSRHLMYYSSEKAKQQLGYDPRPAKKALADAVCWFQTEAENNRSAETLSAFH